MLYGIQRAEQLRLARDGWRSGVLIGSGIFIVSADMARKIGSTGGLLLAWVITAALTIAASLSYGELASMIPRAGGMYIYLTEAFSPPWVSSTAGPSWRHPDRHHCRPPSPGSAASSGLIGLPVYLLLRRKTSAKAKLLATE